jgi:hypothetical protein
MAKRIYIRHKKDNKVHGLRAAYSIHGGDLAEDWRRIDDSLSGDGFLGKRYELGTLFCEEGFPLDGV